jgi:exodeoxyribonuclease-3
MYRDLFAGSPCVLMGDLNSNVKWDREHPVALNHSALVALLDSLGLVSAYHGFHDEEQGQETRPTFYHLKRKETPYHIDYCFVPAVWAKQVRRVDIGVHDDWLVHSDHCPLLVDVAVDMKEKPPTRRPAA